MKFVVVALGFYVPPTAKVIRRRDLGLKSHPKDWRSLGSNSLPLVYKASSLTTTPRRLLLSVKWNWLYRKVPKISDYRKVCCHLPKIQTKRPNLRVLHILKLKDANGIANSEDPDQTAPLGAV